MRPTRRALLLGAAAGLTACTSSRSGAGRSSGAPSSPPPSPSSRSIPGRAAPVRPTRHVYGDDPSQFGELYLPTVSRRPGTVVVIHGGFWRSGYGLDLGAPLAADLAGRGYVAWNIEYRRVGNGGGWPATLNDVATAIDQLSDLDGGLDLSRVAAIGHSAGGQLAAWAAARSGLPVAAPGSSPLVRVTAVVSQAGVLDLRHAEDIGVGAGAVSDLLGGSPSSVGDRYVLASPIERVPLPTAVVCVHGHDDTTVPFDQSTRFVAASEKAGGHAEMVPVAGDHFTLIDVTSAAWAAVVQRLPALLSA